MRLVFGHAAADEPGASSPPGSLFIDTPAVARDIFGWGVIYALHARACIERRRVWQAEHYIGAVRDHALSLACLRHGVVAVQARGYDELPAEILAQFNRTLVSAAEPGTLRAALAASVTALLREGAQAEFLPRTPSQSGWQNYAEAPVPDRLPAGQDQRGLDQAHQRALPKRAEPTRVHEASDGQLAKVITA